MSKIDTLVDAGIFVPDTDADGLYCIYDVVAQDAGPLFQARNDGVAMRHYKAMIDNRQVIPEDYKLLHVGYFDRKELQVVPECKIVVVDAPDIDFKNVKLKEE